MLHYYMPNYNRINLACTKFIQIKREVAALLASMRGFAVLHRLFDIVAISTDMWVVVRCNRTLMCYILHVYAVYLTF